MTRSMVPRRFVRKPVSMPARCRTQTGVRDQGEIYNISIEGCCIRPRNVRLRVGNRIIVWPSGMEALTGVVRWISGDLAGVEFERPIYGPVLDYLARTHSSEN